MRMAPEKWFKKNHPPDRIIMVDRRVYRIFTRHHYEILCHWWLEGRYGGRWYHDTYTFFFPPGFELIKPEILAVLDYLEIHYEIVDLNSLLEGDY